MDHIWMLDIEVTEVRKVQGDIEILRMFQILAECSLAGHGKPKLGGYREGRGEWEENSTIFCELLTHLKNVFLWLWTLESNWSIFYYFMLKSGLFYLTWQHVTCMAWSSNKGPAGYTATSLSLGKNFHLHIRISYVLLFTTYTKTCSKHQVFKGLKTRYLISYYLRSLTYPASTLNDHMEFVLE